jgi:hypothetical protein
MECEKSVIRSDLCGDASVVARRVLERRIRAIIEQLPPDATLRVGLNTRKRPALESGMALSLDWTHRFDEEHAPGRRIVAEGLCVLPAAIALGSTFLATRRLPLAWRQISPNRAPEIWSLDAKPESSGFEAQIVPNNLAGDDLVLAFAAGRPQLHQLRGLVVVTKPGTYPHDLETAGQARDVVRVVVEGLRQARDLLQPRGTLHLFLAVPAGLAVMIGQMLNTFGPVQTYEHVPTGAVGVYEPAALLKPSA